MRSSLNRLSGETNSNAEEMLRLNKDLIIYQNKILIDLNLISPEHYIYARDYALKHYQIDLNRGKK